MSSFRGVWADLLSDAVSAARSVLRELDPPEVPASLHKVAAYSGGRLPPPLAVSLLSDLDSNEWLRGKVAEAWDGDPNSPSGRFLHRPDGWWLDLAAAVQAESANRDDAQVTELEAALSRTDAKLAAATEKAAEYKKKLAQEQKRAREAAAAVRRSLEARHTAAATELERARSEARHLENRLRQIEDEHRELQASFDALRTRLARARRLRIDATGDSTPSRSVPSDPVKLARMLDLQTASFGRGPQRTGPAPEAEAPSLTLEPGVRPDSSDAIRWLLTLDRPVVVLVDGYNAQFHTSPDDFTSGAARRALVDALRRLRASADAPHRIVVVYDSTLPGDRSDRTAEGGVEVRFAEQDSIADEEIIALASDHSEVVVVSSDREVREGSEAGGAVVLWSEALRDFLQRV